MRITMTISSPSSNRQSPTPMIPLLLNSASQQAEKDSTGVAGELSVAGRSACVLPLLIVPDELRQIAAAKQQSRQKKRERKQQTSQLLFLYGKTSLQTHQSQWPAQRRLSPQ